jgi:hypothetical protein
VLLHERTPGIYSLDETISLRQRYGCANNRAACGTYAQRWVEAFARNGILLVVWPQTQERAVVARYPPVTHRIRATSFKMAKLLGILRCGQRLSRVVAAMVCP